MKDKKTKILIFIGIAIIVVTVCMFIYQLVIPKFKYTIDVFPEGEKEEQPLQFIVDKSDVDFSFSFTTGKNEVETAYLQKKIMFTKKPPFIAPASDLVITLRSSRNKPETIEEYLLYEIKGTISKLSPNDYKVRAVDAYDNLIDEKVVTVE